jgi:cytochrome c556
LKKSVPGAAHEEAASDARHLGEIFQNVESYLSHQNVPDAVSQAQGMSAAARELASAAAARNADAESAALEKVNAACAACHAAHREKLAEGGYKLK